ncbi:MAG: hypothetical protein M0Z39_05035 [Actinomycetota bacterium]|nr:hypothetical protein [Actinomycetota bacterium]
MPGATGNAELVGKGVGLGMAAAGSDPTAKLIATRRVRPQLSRTAFRQNLELNEIAFKISLIFPPS